MYSKCIEFMEIFLRGLKTSKLKIGIGTDLMVTKNSFTQKLNKSKPLQLPDHADTSGTG